MKNTIYNVNSDNSCTMNISTQSMKRTEPVEVSNGQKLLTVNSSLLTAFAVLLCLLVGGKAWGQTTIYNFEGNSIPNVFTNNSTNPWVVVSTSQGNGHNGTYCIKSGNSGVASSTSEISITVNYTSAGTISFLGGCWGEGTSTFWDHCDFYIDDERVLYFGAKGTWETYTFDVTAGTHTFKWSYTKDSSVNPTGDAFFVDDITIDMPTVSCPVLTIANATQWNAFAQCVADGNNYSGQTVTLTNDITVNTIVPGTPWTTSSGFHGTFDGQGHTITLNYTTSDNFVGLFRYTYGATIKDLIVDGTINTSNVRTGGLIGLAQYTTTITNCRSNVTINSTYSGPAENGGFVGDAVNKITFTGCVFSGRLLGGNATQNGGFVGYYHYDNYVRTYKDCLFAPSEVSFSTTESATFGRPYASTMNGSYYTQSFGTAQGTQAYSVTGITPVTVAMNGTPTRTYNVSGIDVYATGIVFDNTIYAASGSSLSLNLDGSDRGYLSDHGTLTGSANPYTLAMDAYNTKIAINCLVTSFPWEEDFEGFSASSSGVKLEDPCWVNEHIEGTGAYFFEVYSGTNGTNSTKQVRLRDMYSGTKTKLMLPPMDFGGVAYQFSLDVFRNATGTNYGEGVRVYASTDGNIEGATELAFISRSYQTSDGNLIPAESASGWYRYELILPHTGTCYIILRGESQYGSSTYMDNFRVELAPTCPKPINLTVSDITTSSARLAWDAGGTETSWQSFCALHGESPQWNNPYWTIINNVNSNVPANIPNPQPNTEYDFYVRANCGGGDYSEPIMITFRTACGAYTVTEGSPYIENFNSYSGYSTSTTAPTSPAYPNHTMPDCWTFVNMSASTSTYPQMFLTTNSGYPVSGNCLFFKSSSSTAAYAVLPSFSNNIENLVLAFSYRNEGTGTNNGTLHVGISNNLSDLENSYIEVSDFEQITTITSETVTFATSTTERGNYYIVFKYVGGTSNNYYLSIDNVEVRLAPSCIIPDGLNETSVAATSATLEWMGISDSYNVRYHVPAHVDGFYEEFGSASIPTGWENKSGLLSEVMGGTALTSGSAWYFDTNNGVFDNHARINIYGSSRKHWLITPEVTVGSGYTFSFDLALTAYSGTLGTPATTGTDDRFVVLISTDNEATWSILREWNNNGSSYVYNNISNTATGENVSINISSYVGQTIRIAFYGESTTSNADNNLHIDNVKIGKSVAATAWQTQVVNSEATTITGLSPETTYEWQVQAVCGNSTSDWSDLSSFTTIALPPCDPPSVSISGGTTPTCSGTEQTLSANVSGGTTPYSYSWEWTATGSGTSTISSNAATVSVTPSNTSATASTVTYKVTVNDNAGCSNSATKEIVVKKQPNPSFSPASTTLLVGGADYNAASTLDADGCSSPTWTSSPSGIVTQAGGSVHAVAQGNTTVTASYAATANYCAASANLAVTVNIPQSVSILASAACSGQETTLTATATGFANPQYSWSASPNTITWPANTNSATINVTPTTAGNYTFTCDVTESGGGGNPYSLGQTVYVNSSTGELAGSGLTCYVIAKTSNTITVFYSETAGGDMYEGAAPNLSRDWSDGESNTDYLMGIATSGNSNRVYGFGTSRSLGWYLPSFAELQTAYTAGFRGNNSYYITSTYCSTLSGYKFKTINLQTGVAGEDAGGQYCKAKKFTVSSSVSASTTITVGQAPTINDFPASPVSACESYDITATVSDVHCNEIFYTWGDDASGDDAFPYNVENSGTYSVTVTSRTYRQYDMITQNGIAAIVANTEATIAVPLTDGIGSNTSAGPVSADATLNEAIIVNGGTIISGSRDGFEIAGGVCQSTASVEVEIGAAPTIASISAPSAVCDNSPLTLSTPTVNDNGTTVTAQGWQISSTENGTYSAFTSGSNVTYDQDGYYIRYTATNACGTVYSNKVQITVTKAPTIAAITAPAAVCDGSALTLSAPSVTDYGATVTAEGWEMSSTENGTYSSFTSGSNVTYDQDGYYIRYTATNACGTVYSNAVQITVNNVPEIASISAPAAVCDGGTLSLSAPTVTNHGAAISAQGWQISANGSSYTAFNPSTAVTYSQNNYYLRYYATNTCGTVYSNAVQITVTDEPEIASISAPAAVCDGVTLSLSAPTVTANGATVTAQGWQISSTENGTYSAFTSGSTVSYSQNGYYIRYTATNTCGTVYSNAVQITVNNPVVGTVTASADPATICNGASTELTASATGNSGTMSYLWSTDDIDATISVSPTVNTTYTVTATATVGACTATTSKQVIVTVETPSVGTVTASVSPATICVGKSAELSVSTTGNNGDMTYTWSSGSTTVTPNVTTTYTVTATATTAVAGCTVATTKDVTITVTTPSVDGIASGDMVWSGNAGTTNWATADNWLTYDGSTYSIATSTPSASTNVFLATYGECVISDPVLTAAAATQNLTIGSGRAISLESNTLSVAGNLTNSGTFTAGTGTVVFNGSTHQTISGSSLTFYNVTFDNDKHFTFSGLTPTVNAEATFSSGIVNGNMNFGASATSASASLTSHVDGKVTKTAGSDEFTFPTGNAGVLGSVTATVTADTWIRFHNLVASGDDLPADYPRYWNVADNCSGNDPQFDHVSNFEYWDINSPDGLSGAIVVASADNANKHFGSTDPAPTATDVFGAIWTGSCWNNIGGSNQYVSDDYTTIIVRGVNIPSVTRAGTPYFTLGSKAHETLLPIELLSFTATCDGRSALVEWTTATERNNDYFVLERSDDAINFSEVARVAGAGNSIDPLDYSYTDYGIHGGDNYYRLVQVDYDGTRAVSEVVVVNCIETAAGEPDVQAYPNPFYGELTLELDNFDNRPARIDVYDMLGKLIYTDKVASPQNYYETVLNLSNLPPATYTVRVSTADFVINKKVVKQ